MRARPLRDVGIVVASMVVLLVLVPALVARNSRQTPTTPPSDAFQPAGAEPVAFVFPYRGGNLPAEVLVDANPAGSIGFNVYTDQQWQALLAGDAAVTPLGRGVAAAETPGTLSWRGAAADAGQYHVQVFSLAQPAAFWITVSGPGAGELSRGATATATPAPSPTATQPAPTETPPPIATPTEAPPAQPARPAAASRAAPAAASPTPRPQVALVGAGNFQPIGERGMEFVFQYKGDDLPVQVIVEAQPPGAVGFKVYTDLQWTWFGQGDLSVVPIGQGTANPHAAGNLFWQGNSPMAGRYHVQVVRLAQPARFWIAVAGPGGGELVPVSPPAAP